MGKVDIRRSEVTYVEAFAQRDEAVWQGLGQISLKRAAEQFLATLHGHTQRAYRAAFRSIFHVFTQHQLFDPMQSLQTFALSNGEWLLDEIRERLIGSEATKQARAAAFIALTRYLQRATGGVIRKVLPRKEKLNPTFRPIRETSLTQAMNQAQWIVFLDALKQISVRDYLAAKMILQGAKRVSEVIDAQIGQIHWETRRIVFKQLKSKHLEKFTIITYPQSFMDELRAYLQGRQEGRIFITQRGNPVSQSRLYRSFSLAGRQNELPFTVHPHVLRASAITYMASQGFHSDEIMRVSGHANAQLIRYYDKTPMEKNPTQKIQLI